MASSSRVFILVISDLRTDSRHSQDFPDAVELLIKEAQRASRRRRFRLAAIVLALAVVVVSTAAVDHHFSRSKPSTATAEKKANNAPFPRCSASSDLSAKFIAPNGASGMAYFLIAFTNEGAASCSLSGVPLAQAVSSLGGKPIGPPAKYLPTEGVPRGTVEMRSHGGMAFVQYYVIVSEQWTASQCDPEPARGVELSPDGIKRFYIPIDREGFQLICTKLRSTAIGPLSSKSY